MQPVHKTRFQNRPVNPKMQPDRRQHKSAARFMDTLEKMNIETKRVGARDKRSCEKDSQERNNQKPVNRGRILPLQSPGSLLQRLVPLPVPVIVQKHQNKKHHAQSLMPIIPKRLVPDHDQKYKQHCHIQNKPLLHPARLLAKSALILFYILA